MLTLKLRPKGIVPTGEYQVSVKNIKMATAEMTNKYAGTDLTSPFAVRWLRGDVNCDGKIDISDYIAIANCILNVRQDNINSDAADMNGDGQADVSDYIAVGNTILTGNKE